MISAQLRTVLVCPIDHGPLYVFDDDQSGEQGLYNPRLHRWYQVADGIPNMIPDESVEVDQTRHDHLAAVIDDGGIIQTGPSAESSDQD